MLQTWPFFDKLESIRKYCCEILTCQKERHACIVFFSMHSMWVEESIG